MSSRVRDEVEQRFRSSFDTIGRDETIGHVCPSCEDFETIGHFAVTFAMQERNLVGERLRDILNNNGTLEALHHINAEVEQLLLTE